MKKRDVKIIKGKRYVEYKEPFFTSVHIAFLLCTIWVLIIEFFVGWWNILSFLLLLFFIFLASVMHEKEIERAREDERLKKK